MTTFQTTQIRRRSGDLDVYTGLLLVATVVLTIGAIVLFMNNSEHSADPTVSGQTGGPFKLVEQ